MKRVIVDHKKLTDDILNLLVEKYPFGYNDKDIIQFVKPDGKIVKAVEVKTEDTVYLVKISSNLEEAMDNYGDDEDDDEDHTDFSENEIEGLESEDDLD